jgi:PAS domain S-box-containing protein
MVLRYGAVPLAVAAATVLRWPLWPVLGPDFPFLLFWPTVMLCAWYGGLGPGLLATLLSALSANFFLLEPSLSLGVSRPEELLGLALFVALSPVISLLCELLHRANRRAGLERERLQVTLASIGDGVIVTDAAGRVSFLNGVARALTGWGEDATGRPLEEVFRVVNEQTHLPADNPVKEVLRTGATARLANHTTLLARDGAERPVEDSAAPVRSAGGELLGCVLVFRDVSERRRAQEEVQASQRRLQTLFEHAQDAILLADDQARYVDANPAACELLGLSRDEVLRRTVWDVTPPPNGDLGREAWQAFLRAGKQSGDYQLLRKDQTAVEVEYRAVANIQPGVHLSVLRDVTERKRLEEELRLRVAELAAADRHKDEFLAVLAHELRGPLAPIVNCLQLLRLQGDDPAAAGQARDTIERQVKQLTGLVDDLLDLTRIKQGKVKLQKRPVELSSVVAQVVETCRPLMDARRHYLSVSLPPRPVRLEGDPTRLAQVFTNLLNNSAKYTEEGGRVGLTAEQEGDQVVVRVRDTGVGIAADMLPKVFDLFTQVGSSLHRSQGGLGIGLALVKSLVELHGGSVTATSPGVGQGSEFVVRLPALPVGPEGPEAGGHREGRARSATPSRRVLVVDDNRDAAESLAMLLRLSGHVTLIAHDGPSAVEAAREFRPQAVFLDIGLPGLDGFEVARRLRQEPSLEGVTLVALTGYGAEDDRRKAQEAGFDRHFVKPVELEALLCLLSGP